VTPTGRLVDFFNFVGSGVVSGELSLFVAEQALNHP
jgi:hypothetical protein